MHRFHRRAVGLLALAALLTAAGPAAFAAPRHTPLERAQRIAALTAGGPYDPMSVPACDRLAGVVGDQRDERPR